MIKDIEYKGIKYQELDNPSQLRKLIQNNDININEIQKIIRSEESKKEYNIILKDYKGESSIFH